MLEGHRGTGANQYRQLVDALEGDAVEVEDVLAAIEVGGREGELEDGAGAEGEFAFHADIEAMIGGQAAFVEVGVVDTVFAVLTSVVGDDALTEHQL